MLCNLLGFFFVLLNNYNFIKLNTLFDSFQCIKCLYQTKSNMGVYIKNTDISLSN